MPHPVYLVRHGESEWNVLRLTQGQIGHPRLTARGREQATDAAYRIKAELAGRGATRILTSDLIRAAETAEIIAGIVGGQVELDERLREVDLGDLQGTSYDDTRAALALHDWSEPARTIAGGESLIAVQLRLAAVLAEAGSGDGTTVLVTHGDAMQVLLAHLRGETPGRLDGSDITNGAVARITGDVTWLHDRVPARQD